MFASSMDAEKTLAWSKRYTWHKSWAATLWRTGYVTGSAKLLSQISRCAGSTITSNPVLIFLRIVYMIILEHWFVDPIFMDSICQGKLGWKCPFNRRWSVTEGWCWMPLSWRNCESNETAQHNFLGAQFVSCFDHGKSSDSQGFWVPGAFCKALYKVTGSWHRTVDHMSESSS